MPRKPFLFALVLAALAPGPASAAEPREEVVALRTESGKFFVAADGTKTAILHAAPVHYRDRSGNWREIDTTLVPLVGPSFAFRNGAGPFSVTFARASVPSPSDRKILRSLPVFP